MVIDFGNSPLRKSEENQDSYLPDVDVDNWVGDQIRDDLDDKVFRVARSSNFDFKNTGKFARSSRKVKGSKSMPCVEEDDADVASARSMLVESCKVRSHSDDEDRDDIFARTFRLKTPNITVEGKYSRNTKREGKKKHPPFPTYRNGNIASPFMTPQWMVPQRRISRSATPSSSMTPSPWWSRHRVSNTPKVPTTPKVFTPMTREFTVPKTKTPRMRNRRSMPSRPPTPQGSPSTPTTPKDNWSDIETDSISSQRSPDLELVSKDLDGSRICLHLQKLSPASNHSSRNNSFSSIPPLNIMETDLDMTMTTKANDYRNKSLTESSFKLSNYKSDSFESAIAQITPRKPINNSIRTPFSERKRNMNTNSMNSMKPPLHNSPHSLMDSLLSPDPSAFGSSESRSRIRTPASACPPTPTARPRLTRSTSLGQTKLLATTKTSTINSIINGKQISKNFVRKKLIGEGCFFKVFKIFLKDKHGKSESYALKQSKQPFRSRNHRQMYLREVQLVKSIPLHQNVVKYMAAWQEELHFFVILEHCRCSLAKLIQVIKISENFLWNALFQVAQALQHIHYHGILHMDVKPGNILYGKDNMLKLADFGQAIRIDRKKQMLDGCEGDSKYMAPELMRNDAIPTDAADVFSLGLVMVELATRKPLPGEGEGWQNLRKGKAREYLIGSMGRGLESVILRMLNPGPPGRASAAQVVAVARENIKLRNRK
eukprot:CAMPEP_0167746860 /NCGR_PEP_ID=MMETSP0110_2-20121227/3951_1 /TAXON_ID=629695 /ORGANISM="Gymnochlora sp., Strain CCMP2014" /LENGTH=713 /DNA_ID=CAMNT_0007631679 /DNA_START=63 /DNA_END=2204 /DNA_ORIENTATION=-